MKKIITLLTFSLLLFNACKNTDKTTSDNLLNATVWFQQSAEMHAAYIQAFNIAKEKLQENISNAQNNMPKAVIVDIDETMLDNSPFEAYLIKNNLSYNKKLWNQWVKMAKAEALPGALDFAKFAKDNNVEIFYVSNRSIKNLIPTMQNLKEKGFPYADTTHILLKDTSSDKTPRREKIMASHDVILLIGDNLRDFDEIFKDRSDNFGKKAVDDNKKLFGSKYIVLPNPMYGQWQKAYYIPNKKISEQELLKNMKNSLKAY